MGGWYTTTSESLCGSWVLLSSQFRQNVLSKVDSRTESFTPIRHILAAALPPQLRFDKGPRGGSVGGLVHVTFTTLSGFCIPFMLVHSFTLMIKQPLLQLSHIN